MSIGKAVGQPLSRSNDLSISVTACHVFTERKKPVASDTHDHDLSKSDGNPSPIGSATPASGFNLMRECLAKV